MTDMKHMEFLQAVASSDVEVLRRKEATYQGSWKRAGGRSAWFMFRRNMDRLLSMMARPPDLHGFSLADLDDAIASVVPAHGECALDVSVVQYLRDSYVSENIFAKIREKPDGADGTVLACLRDLRRYAMLIEAEMVARGVVKPEGGIVAEIEERVASHRDFERGGSVSGRLTPMTGLNLSEERMDAPSLSPWIVTRKVTERLPARVASLLYCEWHPQRCVLATHLMVPEQYELSVAQMTKEEAELVQRALRLYDRDGDLYYLRIAECPPGERDAWPSVAHEYNVKEWSEQEKWIQKMYVWIESQTKYRLQEKYAAWRVS